MGLAIAIEIPDALTAAAVHRSRSLPCRTPRSWDRKIGMNGNAKLKPKIAVNSANHSAARLRRQFTPPELIAGTVARGSVDRVLRAQDFDDQVGRDRQAVDDGVRFSLAQRVLDGIRDRGGGRDGSALTRSLESLGVGVGRRRYVHEVGSDDLTRAHDGVVEEAGRAEVSIRAVNRLLVQRIAKTVRKAAVHLALDDELVDRLSGVVGDDVAKNLDLACIRIDRDHGGVAAAGVG